VSVAPVENFPIKKHDRLAQPMGTNVRNKLVERLALKQREDVGQRVKFE
jgi:hypothetical protein